MQQQQQGQQQQGQPQEHGNHVVQVGWVNHLKQNHQYQSSQFSITLLAGKDQQGNYRKEYFDVKLGPELTQSSGILGGERVKVTGRLRSARYQDPQTGQNKSYPYIQAFGLEILEQARQQNQQQQPYQQQNQPYQQQQGQHQGQQQYQQQPQPHQDQQQYQQPQHNQQQQQPQQAPQQQYQQQPNMEDIPF